MAGTGGALAGWALVLVVAIFGFCSGSCCGEVSDGETCQQNANYCSRAKAFNGEWQFARGLL